MTTELSVLREGTRYIVGLHQSNGDVSYFERAASHMPTGWGVATIASSRLPLDDVPEALEQLAARYCATMTQAWGKVPVVLGGIGLGGLLSLACATAEGTSLDVRGLFPIETKIPEPAWAQRPNDLDTLSRTLVEHRAKWAKLPPPMVTESDPIARVRSGLAALGIDRTGEQAAHELRLFQKHVRGIQTYRARPLSVPCILFTGDHTTQDMGWGPIAPHAIHRTLPGDHYTLASHPEHVAAAASALITSLA